MHRYCSHAVVISQERAIHYMLEEPNLEEDFDRWAAWFEHLKTHRDELVAFMAPRGVRTLPTAIKSAGPGGTQDAAASLEECVTLHGQAGGGL